MVSHKGGSNTRGCTWWGGKWTKFYGVSGQYLPLFVLQKAKEVGNMGEGTGRYYVGYSDTMSALTARTRGHSIEETGIGERYFNAKHLWAKRDVAVEDKHRF